jgi:hypothetical protein
MFVHHHQSGHHALAPQVYDFRVGWDVGARRRANGLNHPAPDDDRLIRLGGCAGSVNHASMCERDCGSINRDELSHFRRELDRFCLCAAELAEQDYEADTRGDCLSQVSLGQTQARRFTTRSSQVQAAMVVGYLQHPGSFQAIGPTLAPRSLRDILNEEAFISLPRRADSYYQASLRGEIFMHRFLLLRSHPSEAEPYCHLKKELADRFGTDREGYTDAKTSFIEAIVDRAAKRER